MAYRRWFSFVAVFAEIICSDQFTGRIMPEIVSKFFWTGTWSGCGVYLDSERTPFSWTERWFRSAVLHWIWICTWWSVAMPLFYSESVVRPIHLCNVKNVNCIGITWWHHIFTTWKRGKRGISSKLPATATKWLLCFASSCLLCLLVRAAKAMLQSSPKSKPIGFVVLIVISILE